MMSKARKRALPLRTTGAGILCWREPVRRKQGATPAGPKIAWLGLHVLIISLLRAMDNDLTAGGAGYQAAFWFAVVGNVVAFACAANSNPGYVDERDRGDRDALAERGSVRGTSRGDDDDDVAPVVVVGDGDATGAAETDPPRDKGKAPAAVATVTLTEAEDDEDTHVELLATGTSSSGGGADDAADAADDVAPLGQVCGHCDAWQGLRTKHCHDCGRCVRKFDHHCFWVGTCVGEKNHARFVTYLFTETAGILWAFHISNTGVRMYNTWDEMFSKNAGPVLMSFALFLFILFVGGLFGFHVFCIATNQTTWEIASKRKISYLKGVPDNVYAFDRGLARNVREFCCALPPARYEMRSLRELRQFSEKETIWENRYWVCC